MHSPWGTPSSTSTTSSRAAPGGAVRFIRRALGVEAFGINRFDLPASREGIEHDEAGTDQEEVSIGSPRGAYTPHGPF